MKLYLTCPNCKQESQYGGYPARPNLSLVTCLKCGYVAMGCNFVQTVTKEDEG